VSFKIKSGTTVALVGPTGAGKTTIVNLITRFYETDSGQILIDNKDITEYTRKSLRSSFSVVLQDTCMFTGSIADNIRYSNPEASDEQVIEAAKTAGVDEFISRLKDGYMTEISSTQGSLSEGQRQLLSIARAVLCDAPILILDEATSSVDTRTESMIQKAMINLSKGRTSFIIAHRLSTIKNSDIILVVQDKGIAESGTHNELIKKDGIYAAMYRSQTEG
jgi:ATP-binding cassette, subfamily B, multidrug efflux pump